MDRAGAHVRPMTDNELSTVFQVVTAGGSQGEARQRFQGRSRTTVNRAFNVVSQFERLGLTTLNDAEAQQVANAAGYEATIHHVQTLFLKWKVYKGEFPLAVERKDGTPERQRVEAGPEEKHEEPEGILWVPRHPELGPHTRELFYLGRRFRDWLFVSQPEQYLATAIDTGGVDFIEAAIYRSMEHPSEMWWGRAERGAKGRKLADAEEEKVEQEWGLVLYDATAHSLFDSFREHLQGHPCWTLLEVVKLKRSVYLEEVRRLRPDMKRLRAAYEDLRKSIQEFQACLGPDALLRKLILNGWCDLCPSARGVPVAAKLLPPTQGDKSQTQRS